MDQTVQTAYKDDRANQQYNALQREIDNKIKKEQELQYNNSNNSNNNNTTPGAASPNINNGLIQPSQETINKTRNDASQILNEELTNKEKTNNPLDISLIIDKIDKLQMPDTDKAFLLNQIKLNMGLPSLGEDESINHIQNKYITQNQNQNQNLQFQPQINSNQQNQNQNQNPIPYYNTMQPQQQQQQYQPQYQPQYQQSYPSNIMTTVHYDILKNKLDAVQLELIDLLRHVKDYTQRYMNSVRQQDMDKIDTYITGLFNVDKQIKEAKEQDKQIIEKMREEESLEEEPETQQSIISKATNGIKNFFGGIGNNVSGITKLVSSTANIANNLLSKKIIGSNTPEAKPPIASSPGSSPGSSPEATSTQDKIVKADNKHKIYNTNKINIPGRNIVSIDDYISSNANHINALQQQTNQQQHNINNISSNSNYINSLSQQSQQQLPKPISNNITISNNDDFKKTLKTPSKPDITPSTTPEISPDVQQDAPDDDITNALSQLNTHITDDINNTITEGDTYLNDTPQTQTQPQTQSTEPQTAQNLEQPIIQSGGTRINKLHKNINLLKLKITKHKLKTELKNIQKHNINNVSKTHKQNNIHTHIHTKKKVK